MHRDTIIKTRRLLLRPPRLDDAVTIAARINNRRISSMTARVPWPYDLDDARAFLDHAATIGEGEAVFVITAPDSGPIGTIGFELDRPGEAAALGYWLAEPWWNRGIASEAAGAVVAHAFDAKGHDRMVSRCLLGNEASRRVLIGAGFRPAGIASYRSLAAARTVVCQCFELTRREWAHLHKADRASKEPA